MRTIAIANQKGGVGKTTTAINLGYCLALADNPVLIVDIDPQANATSGLGVTTEPYGGTYQVLTDGFVKPESVRKTNAHPKLSVIPSSPTVSALEQKLIVNPTGQLRLKEGLSKLDSKFTFVLIDCPPSLGTLHLNALNAADSVIIPIQCEYFSMEGLSQMIKIINTVRAESNPGLFIEGILLTMFDRNLEYNKEVALEIRKHFGSKVYRTVISRDVAVSEASGFAKPVLDYAVMSVGTSRYVELTREVLGYSI